MSEIFKKENIYLNESASSKTEAIEKAGNVLAEKGYVDADYVTSMLEREQISTTYIGNKIAIPHGTEDSKKLVKQSGISVLQLPEGVMFDDNEVNIVVGIAGKDGEHLEILSKIAITCSEEENVERLIHAKSEEEIIAIFEEAE
ncbi:PTS sugar transporter subunit IIA [Jeotgalibacillus terrae]|uniref:Mannitol-specific phosphotransferase enzyme IIA component n=1 Tax=Jeotgalibacillus terrae TaxID=587735 RepID=A0ABW5ZGI4_9BACL|nr:PTS sugar transporter subunit IIA [Jeotgalibacillus terrae]MBM7579357.1 PTS system mannitol-specific IIA component [Jeotgalibacillus terrae]